MSRDCFDLMCQKIIADIGGSKFKSEYYIFDFLMGKDNMYDENTLTSGGYISGEV